MAKLISTLLHRAGTDVSLAIVGTVSFDEKGETIIDDQVAEQLAAYLVGKDTLGYKIVLDGEKKPSTKAKTPKAKPESKATDVNSEEEVEEEETEDETEDESDDETEEDSDDNSDPGADTILAGMDLAALRQMAAESGFPEEEWSKKNTKTLKKYLAEKLA